MKFFIVGYNALLFAVSVIGVVNFKKLTTPFILLLVLVLLTLTTELAVRIISSFLINPAFVYHIYAPIQFALMCGIVYLLAAREWRYAVYIILSCAFVYLTYFFFNSAFIQSMKIVPSNAILLGGVFYLIFITLIMIQLLRSEKPLTIWKDPTFWFVLGTLVFYSIHVMVFGVYNRWLAHIKHLTILDYFNWFGNIAMYFCYGIALWLGSKQNRKRAFFHSIPEKPSSISGKSSE